jgi:nucleotide-binding universal stress UspA family protein
VLREQQAAARAQLERLSRRFQRRVPKMRMLMRTGAPALVIADVAQKLKTDLIVMSTHGRTGISHLFLGSVTEKVVRTAACPVLTVRAAAGRRQPGRARSATAKNARRPVRSRRPAGGVRRTAGSATV